MFYATRKSRSNIISMQIVQCRPERKPDKPVTIQLFDVQYHEYILYSLQDWLFTGLQYVYLNGALKELLTEVG